jgi:hypothetical protein
VGCNPSRWGLGPSRLKILLCGICFSGLLRAALDRGDSGVVSAVSGRLVLAPERASRPFRTIRPAVELCRRLIALPVGAAMCPSRCSAAKPSGPLSKCAEELVVSRIFRTGSVQSLSHFRLAERRPALAHAVMVSLISWSFSNSMFRYLLVDHAVPAMWRSLAAARLSAD